MATAEIPTVTATRFEPPSISSEELGDTIELSRRQSRLPRNLGTESPTVMLGAAQCVSGIVEHETPARDLQALLQAWRRAQEMLSKRPRATEFSHTRIATSAAPHQIQQLVPSLPSVRGAISTAAAETAAVVEQEYEIFVTPEPQHVRHVTARIVSRSCGEPKPILD